MKKLLIILFMLSIFAMLLIAGCGSNSTKQTIDTDQGEITVEQGDGSSQYQMGDTKTEVGKEKEPTADDLGIPIYDGAEYVPGSGIPANISNPDGTYSMVVGEFTTADSLSRVTGWYAGKLGEPGIKTDTQVTWLFKRDDGVTTSDVTLKVEEGKVKITIYRLTKKS